MTKEHFSVEAEELLAEIGISLLLIQDMEHFFTACMKLVFPDELPRTMDEFLTDDRRTFGTLVKEMKKLVDVSPEFDCLLRQTLEDRNLFVHRLQFQSWYDIHTKEGQDATWDFLGRLFEEVKETNRVFQAFIWRLHQEHGVPETEDERILRNRGFIQDLEANYVPSLDRIAPKKKTN